MRLATVHTCGKSLRKVTEIGLEYILLKQRCIQLPVCIPSRNIKKQMGVGTYVETENYLPQLQFASWPLCKLITSNKNSGLEEWQEVSDKLLVHASPCLFWQTIFSNSGCHVTTYISMIRVIYSSALVIRVIHSSALAL